MRSLVLLLLITPFLSKASPNEINKKIAHSCPQPIINISPANLQIPQEIEVDHKSLLRVKLPEVTEIRIIDKNRDFWDKVSEIALPILNFAFVVVIFFWQFFDRRKQRQE